MRKMKNLREIDESMLFTYIMPRYGFPLRPAQLEMSEKAGEAFQTHKVFIAEAEVGTGKTFAYLIPAINQIKRTGLPVLISTGTISLQEQLYRRDIPQLNGYLKKEGLIDRDLVVSLEKGKDNYICEKRLSEINEPDNVLSAIRHGYKFNLKFDRNEFDMPISDETWNHINVHNCSINHCDCADCRYKKKRLESTDCDIMVCNHHYMLSCLKDGRRNFLKQFSGVVIDEAHNLENAAFAIFGENRGYDNYEKCIRAALSFIKQPDYQDFIRKYADAASSLAGKLFEAVGHESTPPEYAPEFATEYNVRITPAIEKMAYRLIGSLRDLSDQISIYQNRLENAKFSDDSIQKQIGRLSGFLRNIYSHEDYVWWTQKERGLFRLYYIPKTIAEDLYDVLFSQSKPVILTSATLSENTGAHDTGNSFDYFNFKTGIDKLRLSKYLTPISEKSGFDYAEHGLIYIEKDIPFVERIRGAEYIEYLRKLAGQIRKAILCSNGKTLVLFTSKDAMEFTYSLVAPTIRNELGIRCYMQGQSPVVRTLFEKEIDSCLFATGSFWEGIDIKGPSLSTLIIHKLPFPVPTPINEYKDQEMRMEGLGSVIVPEMLTKLRQGSGRLIRDVTDRGVLVILDSRAASKKYEGIIRKNLPPFKPINNIETIREFLLGSEGSVGLVALPALQRV
jgi:ATP-dependent DNA helicase DinG